MGRVFGYNETVLFFRYVQAMSTLLAGTSGVFRTQLLVAKMNRDEREQPIHYWNEVTQHVADMGGVQLEFVYWKESTDEVICRLRWFHEHNVQNDEAAWQFNYSVPGQDGLRATLTASGHSRRKLPNRRLIDLYRVFDTFCQNWSSVPLAGTASRPAAPVIAFPSRSGRILPSRPLDEEVAVPVAVPADDRRAA
jgi:hypothetical protein